LLLFTFVKAPKKCPHSDSSHLRVQFLLKRLRDQ